MDFQRAKEIFESKGIIEVVYQDKPVWIEAINQDQTAQISFFDSELQTEVPIAHLKEK